MLVKADIPQDTTYLPGMKTIMADRSQRDQVTYIKDIEYVCRDGYPLFLQLLKPALCELRTCPLVVYVQGSAWLKQNCYSNLPMLSMIARRGYVVASVEYRSAEEAPFPGFLQDVKSAIRFLRVNAAKYDINPEKVAVWGDSSGGHASLLVGLTSGVREFTTKDNYEVSEDVSAVIDFYGPTDLTRINDAPRGMHNADKTEKEKIPENILFGGIVAEQPEIAQAGNPLNYVTKEKSLPPILIAHGDWDPVVPFNQSVLMYQKLVEHKKVVEFYKVIGAEHGKFMWTAEMMNIVEDFLKAYM